MESHVDTFKDLFSIENVLHLERSFKGLIQGTQYMRTP